jgi:hypothetical protein
MAQPIILPSFAAGELAPSMYGRVDLAKYHVGAALLRNFFVDYRGGASSRTGTKFVGECKDSSTINRLIPFQFNTLQAYALVFGNFTMRVVMNGGYVTEPSKTITGITNSTDAVFSLAAHGYSVGDLLYLNNILGMPSINERFVIVQTITTNSFTVTDMYGVTLNTLSAGIFISGVAGRVFTLVTPYAAADLELIKFAQSADVMTLVHPSYTPQTLTRTQHWAWTITPVSFIPSAQSPSGVTVTNNGVGTVYGTTFYNYQATAVVGGIESLPSNTPGTGGVPALGQNTGAQNTVHIPSVPNAQLYNIYRTQENLDSPVPFGALFGYIGAITPSTTNTFIDDNILPDFTNCPPQAYNPFTVAGNPGCVTYYQQRQVFGGMSNAPEQLDFSKSGDFFNMNFSIPGKPDDNIEITIGSQQVNAIKHLVSMQSLIALTSSGAWKIDAGVQGAAVTPTTISAVPQAYNGCSDVAPLTINYDILYVQAKGSIVRDLAYNFYVNIYTGTDITLLSNHLFFGHQITEWCYAEEPFKVVWSVRDDGILLSLTYLKEQDVNAWAHHDTQGLFKSICSISEGNENAVYVIVERMINGVTKQYIERFSTRNMGGDPTIDVPADVTRAWFVDCGLQYPLNYPAVTLTPTEVTNVPVVYGVDLIFGGSGYSSATYATITDSTGTGAVLSLSISGGVIQSMGVVSQGVNYTNPTITISDPNGGTGAVAQAIVASPVVMNASAAFTANIGDVVRINNGMGKVLQVNSTTQITVNVITPLTNIWSALSGSWSITTPVSIITGLDHLDGQVVSILGDGSVHPQQTVVNGSITLDHACSAITVGLPYTCQLQSLYIDIEGQGTIQSKRKKINAVTVRMQDSRGMKVGPTFETLTEIKERTTENYGQPIQLFTGDQRQTTSPAYTLYGQICVQQDNPLPCTVLALIPEIIVGDTEQ